VNDLDGDEVIMDVTAGENKEQSTKVAEKEVSTANPVITTGEVVTTDEDVEVTTAATTPQITKDDRKETEVPHTEPQTKENVSTTSNDPLPSGEDSMQLNELMVFYNNLQQQVLDLEEAKTAQAKEIASLKKRVKKLEKMRKSKPVGLKRLKKVGSSRRVESSKEKDSLVDETQDRYGDDLLFDTNDLTGKGVFAEKNMAKKEHIKVEKIVCSAEMYTDQNPPSGVPSYLLLLNKSQLLELPLLLIVDVTAGKNVEQDATIAKKDVSAAESVEGITTAITLQISKDDVTLVQTLIEIKAAKPRARGVIVQEPISAAPSVDSAAPTAGVTKVEITLAQALAALKRAKPKVVIQEPEKSTTIPTAATTVTTSITTPRSKGIFFHEEIDEELARKLVAEEQEGARLKRAQQDEEANISWDNIRAMIDADRLLAERLQQKLDENVETEVDDSPELKNCLEIVPKDEDDVSVDATLLSLKSSTIIDYKIQKEGKKTYFKIIRADGNS
nr:hypothetical protein [Tanacetum cinerariifolium]